MREEYTRTDFAKLERGKFYGARNSTYIVFGDYRHTRGGTGWKGFLVRVPGTPRKLFSVRGLGYANARREAYKYRDEQVKRCGFANVAAMMKWRAPENSGTLGVRLEHFTGRYEYKGQIIEYEARRWVARWRVNGKRISRYFSVEKYGYRAARTLAMMVHKANAPPTAKRA